MPNEPEKAVNLIWAVDEVIIALQHLRERLKRLAENEAKPRKPAKPRERNATLQGCL